MSTVPPPAPRRLHYAWIVAGLTFLTLLASAGVRASVGVLIVPFEQEFHWSRTMISAAVSVNLVLYGLTGPFAADIIDRFGVRSTMATALSVVALVVATTTLIPEPRPHLLIRGLVLGGSPDHYPHAHRPLRSNPRL